MLFNSLEFLLFLPVVFVLYWFVFQRSLRIQNGLLLVASYIFYAGWDYRFLFLLMFSTFLDYFTGLKMQQSAGDQHRRRWFWLSVVVNVGFLGVFKYYNFFVTSFAELLLQLGLRVDIWTLQVILPVGISFYTFHGLSYVIDVYNRKIPAETNFVDYAVFVSYFPLLVAGPIERATHLLPQIKQKRFFDSQQAMEGVERILWGFFKKVVIADSMAVIVNTVYSDSGSYSSTALAVAALAFSFQIYGDFSGYSDIAIGVSKLFGIDLLRNFNFPYLARNIGEFWRRWHISLSSWFRDYLYYPLGGSKVNFTTSVRNVFIIFLVSGFWHGANWTFIVWGMIHALLFVPSFIFKSNRKYVADLITRQFPVPRPVDLLHIAITFVLVTLAWVFFRSGSLGAALGFLGAMFSFESGTELVITNNQVIGYGIAYLIFFGMSAYFLYRQNDLIQPKPVRLYATSLVLLTVITLFGEFTEQSFIYFQF
jgi:D-alanyl-lipoteichoic acid acyltransferase DltB (MBOAT superfamily)